MVYRYKMRDSGLGKLLLQHGVGLMESLLQGSNQVLDQPLGDGNGRHGGGAEAGNNAKFLAKRRIVSQCLVEYGAVDRRTVSFTSEDGVKRSQMPPRRHRLP